MRARRFFNSALTFILSLGAKTGARATGASFGEAGGCESALRRRVEQEATAELGQKPAS